VLQAEEGVLVSARVHDVTSNGFAERLATHHLYLPWACGPSFPRICLDGSSTPGGYHRCIFINSLRKTAAFRVDAELKSLQVAVESNDLDMIEIISNDLWDTDYTEPIGKQSFRRAIAQENGADLYRVQAFEQFLLSVIRHRRWFNVLSQRPLGDLTRIEKVFGENVEMDTVSTKDGFHLGVDVSLGLKIVKKYLDPEPYPPRHFGWLSDFLLLMVFDGLLFEARYSAEYSIRKSKPLVRFSCCENMTLLINNLTLLRDEISARLYDAQELARRLRQMDAECGYVIPSLVYPLVAAQEQKPPFTAN
jgi:hypothetical protein